MIEVGVMLFVIGWLLRAWHRQRAAREREDMRRHVTGGARTWWQQEKEN